MNRKAGRRVPSSILLRLVAVVFAGSAALAGCGVAAMTSFGQSEPEVPAPTTQISGAEPANILAQLENIVVKGRSPKTGYSRAEFGPAWADVDKNSCDTRNDILRRDLSEVTFRAGTGSCVVESGTLLDPYTGKTIQFQRGAATSAAVQIDHVVPLADSWVKGAQFWAPEKRLAFANDPRNLLAVDGPTNQKKSSGDLATWLPPNKAFRCQYVGQIVQVKAAYGLWMTAAEKDQATRILTSCIASGTGGPESASAERLG